MNGTFLADLPGARPDWVGRTPLRLTSLGVATGAGVGSGSRNLERRLRRGAPARRAGVGQSFRAGRAAEVVGTLGRALGHLIATLKLAPPSAPYHPVFVTSGGVPPSAWRTAYLSHWARVERIWLGGGLTAALGDFFIDDARAEAERLGVHGCAIDLAPYADVLALIGAARSRHEPLPVGVVLDFGASAVKRAVALVHDGALARLEILSARPAPPPDSAGGASFVVEAIADTILEARRIWGEVDPYVPVSIASYVVGGRPVSSHGSYGSLAHLERRQLEAELQLRTGAPVRLQFLHDGRRRRPGRPRPPGPGRADRPGQLSGRRFPAPRQSPGPGLMRPWTARPWTAPAFPARQSPGRGQQNMTGLAWPSSERRRQVERA